MFDALRCIGDAARQRAPVGSIDGDELENACGRHRLWVFDRGGRLRPALRARLFSHAAVERQPLGPRRLRLRAGRAKSPLGDGPASCRRDRRPVRCSPCAVRRRHPLRAWPGADGAFDQCGDARSLGRRADRLRSFRHHVSDRAGGLRQDIAGRVALDRLRSWNGGGLVRSVPLFAARRFLDGRARLAECAGRLRHCHSCCVAGFAGARVAGVVGGDLAGRFAVAARGARRSARASLLRAADARLLHLRLSACVHHRALAGLPRRSRPLLRCRRLDAWRRSGCSISSAR